MSISVDKAGAGVGPASPMGVIVPDTGIRQEWWLDCFMLKKEEECGGQSGTYFLMKTCSVLPIPSR